MILLAAVAICVILMILGFLAPRLSAKPQRGVNKTLSTGGNVAGMAPGKAGKWLRKPFDTANKAPNKGAAAGDKGRRKMPLAPPGRGALLLRSGRVQVCVPALVIRRLAPALLTL